MAKRALSWKRAAAIGWRDLKSAPAKFGFVVLSVAVGVAALVGVRGLSERFRQTLGTEARSLLAGDLSARLSRQPSAGEQAKIDALNHLLPAGQLRSTWVTETLSMASIPEDPVPILVTLKAVDPSQYPPGHFGPFVRPYDAAPRLRYDAAHHDAVLSGPPAFPDAAVRQ